MNFTAFFKFTKFSPFEIFHIVGLVGHLELDLVYLSERKEKIK